VYIVDEVEISDPRLDISRGEGGQRKKIDVWRTVAYKEDDEWDPGWNECSPWRRGWIAEQETGIYREASDLRL
jgi:hypothetical protein